MKTLRKAWKKVFGGRDHGPRKVKWKPWSSNIGLALVQSKLEGRWSDKKREVTV